MSPVRFELDKRAFGVVTFPRPKGQTRTPLAPLHKALETSLGVRVQTKRKGWFGPKILSFTYMGETVAMRILGNGDASFDLGAIDDEVRETILEHMRQSHDFEGR